MVDVKIVTLINTNVLETHRNLIIILILDVLPISFSITIWIPFSFILNHWLSLKMLIFHHPIMSPLLIHHHHHHFHYPLDPLLSIISFVHHFLLTITIIKYFMAPHTVWIGNQAKDSFGSKFHNSINDKLECMVLPFWNPLKSILFYLIHEQIVISEFCLF